MTKDQKRLRILWVSHLMPYPPKGGVLQRAYNMINELAKYHDVTLVAFNQKDLVRNIYKGEDGIKDIEKNLRKICTDVTVVDIPLEKYKFGKAFKLFASIFTPSSYNMSWLRSHTMAELLQKEARKNYDVVHFDTISLAIYGNIFSDSVKILNHHNIESHMLLRRSGNERNILKKGYLKLEGEKLNAAEKKYCPEFDLNLSCSELDSERLRVISPEVNVEEIENGVDLHYFNTDKKMSSRKGLVFAGRLDAYSNKVAVEFLAFNIWPLVREAYPTITLDIIGANPPESVLNLAKSDSRIKVHGFVSDVRPYLAAARLYVCPITDGGGTKLKVLDALAMRVPLLANPIACEGIGVVNGKSVLFATDENSYVKKILEYYDDDNKLEALAENGRVLVEQEFGYEQIGVNLSHLYESCVQQKKWEEIH